MLITQRIAKPTKALIMTLLVATPAAALLGGEAVGLAEGEAALGLGDDDVVAASLSSSDSSVSSEGLTMTADIPVEFEHS
jgi:hypothetical protein